MPLKNTSRSFGFIAKSFHWITALLVLGLLSAGFFMTEMAFSPFKLQIYGLHKSFGILVLMLVAGRILWRFHTPPPEPLETHQRWEKTLSRLIHFLLYAGLIGMPLSGWVMSSAGDFKNSFFGIFELPKLTGKNEDIFRLSRRVHEITALMIIAALGLHMAGAFKHHFIDKDSTLQRMSLANLGVSGGILLALISGILLAVPALLFVKNDVMVELTRETAGETQNAVSDTRARPNQADFWHIDHSESRIQFEVMQYGTPFTGTFENFEGDIVFDPDNLAQSRAHITVDIGSLKTGSADRDEQALGQDWFYTEKYPQAVFKANTFSKTGDNEYLAKGDLTIRGVTIPVDFPFLLEIHNKDQQRIATMTSTLRLQRSEFGIGQGQWESGEAIGDMVVVDIKVRAIRK